MPNLNVTTFGGINYADDAAALLARSHIFDGQAWAHRLDGYGRPIGMEAASGQNFDILRGNLVKRKGSTSYADLTVTGVNVFLAGDVVVLGPYEVRLPATNSYTRFVVSKKTIYTDQSGVWVQILTSAGAAYTHTDATVTSAAIVVADGGVFFGLNGANKIQRYRSGNKLDVQMDNGNAYTDAGGTARVITGTWGTAYDRLAVFNGRLVFNDGTSTIQYTDVNQPWDLVGGGNAPAAGKVMALQVHVPQFGNSLAAILYIGTGVGWQFTSDLASINNISGSQPPMSQRLVLNSRNWICYLSDRGALYGINGNRVIDIGRRLKARDASSGPLDTINLANTLTVGNSVYNVDKQQAWWLISTAASGQPDTTIVLDFQLGEPQLDEPLPSYEQIIRCLKWTGQDFASVHVTQDGIIGARSGGIMWTMENGYSDLGATAISATWFSPILDAMLPVNDKNWTIWFGRGLNAGAWNVQIDYLLDRDQVSSKSYQFSQGVATSTYGTATYGTGTYQSAGIVVGSDDTDLISEAIQIKLTQGADAQNFTVTALEQRYDVLVEER